MASFVSDFELRISNLIFVKVSMKASLTTFVMVLSLLCGGSVPVARAADTAKVHRTGIGSPNAFIFVAGIDKGFYKDNGLETLTIMAQPQVGVQGLIGGSFDFSQILGASTTAIMRGVGLKIVMVFDSKPQFWLFGAPEIKTLQDVKGKTVAIQTIGGASGHMTRELAQQKRYRSAARRDDPGHTFGGAACRAG